MALIGRGWGRPPWAEPPKIRAAPLPDRCDVAVVGAGLTGLACTLELARRGRRVVCLEADGIGSGASGRTGGIVLEDSAAGPLEGIEGCIDALARVVHREGIGCGLRRVDARELLHRAPGPAPPAPPVWIDGDRELGVASVVPAAVVDPVRLLSGLARAVERAGGAIVTGTPVRSFEGAGRVRLETERGEVVADHGVLALNAYLGRLAGRGALRAALTLALCTEPIDGAGLAALGLEEGNPWYTLDLPYLWGRTLEDGRVIFGGGLALHPADEFERLRVGSGEPRDLLDRLETRVRGLHPGLSDVPIETRWGGPVAFRPDRTPVLGRRADAPGVILTGGFAGHGIALAFRTAERIADAIVDGRALPDWGAPAQKPEM